MYGKKGLCFGAFFLNGFLYAQRSGPPARKCFSDVPLPGAEPSYRVRGKEEIGPVSASVIFDRGRDGAVPEDREERRGESG